MLPSSALCPKPLLPRRSKLLPIFPEGRSHFSLNFWASLDPEVTAHQIFAELYPLDFFFVCNKRHLQFTPGALNYTGVSSCATSYYLPWAYSVYNIFFFFFFLERNKCPFPSSPEFSFFYTTHRLALFQA